MLKDLILKLLTKDPVKRIKMENIKVFLVEFNF